ncbi:glutamate synthase, partial [Singulisphaera rosea]
MTDRKTGEDPALLSIPDIREYDRINAELIQSLEDGVRSVRLLGAEGQRFLAAGLVGPWNAVIEVEGRAGPEIAAG